MVATKGGGISSSGAGAGAGAGVGVGLSNLIAPITAECCMCGDYGLSQQLFRCKICKSRFQHKYCSNQYPKADIYKACNWCLTQKHESVNSPNSSSPGRNNCVEDRRDHTVKNKRNPDDKTGHRGSEMQLTSTGLIKKLHGSSPEKESPAISTRKKAAGGVVVEEKNNLVLRKSKSANHLSISGGIKARPVFRNKVIRRYKLLDEVSSQ